jgi:hypothetical protein
VALFVSEQLQVKPIFDIDKKKRRVTAIFGQTLPSQLISHQEVKNGDHGDGTRHIQNHSWSGPGQDRDELDIFGEQNIRTEASLSSFVKPLREGGTGGSCLLVFFFR